MCPPCWVTVLKLNLYQKIAPLIITRLCNRGREGEDYLDFVYVPRIFTHIFLSGRRPCWLRLSCHWWSCWVGGTLCCPSLGSVISGRRWCLSGWPLDSTDTGWTLWQVRETFTKLFTLSLFFCFLLSSFCLFWQSVAINSPISCCSFKCFNVVFYFSH